MWRQNSRLHKWTQVIFLIPQKNSDCFGFFFCVCLKIYLVEEGKTFKLRFFHQEFALTHHFCQHLLWY